MSKCRKIPPKQNAAFAAAMEDVPSVYQSPYAPEYSVVCMDESNKQMMGEIRVPVPGKTGQAG